MHSLHVSKIRPAKLMKIASRLYKDDLILFKNDNLITVNCPACGSKKYNQKYTKMGFHYVLCNRCLTLFLNPRPSEHALEIFYTSSKSMMFWNKIFKQTARVRKKKIFEPRIKMILEILKRYGIKKCNTMVEVGAGYGWFCELAKEQRFANQIIAIEPSPTFSARCRKIPGIKVIESTIEKYTKLSNVDLILNFELIAHLFNPKVFLESCYRGLRSGGLFICSTPNYFGLDMQMLKEKSDSLSPHALNLFNTKSIKILLNSIGFKDIMVITPGLMDVSIILNKIKSGEIKAWEYPFFNMIIEQGDDEFINDLQSLLQKYKMSSHMVVSAMK
jgi:SAM-dependent methyltransferase